jgi:RNA polymerase sigma factor (TIGR02999 family)
MGKTMRMTDGAGRDDAKSAEELLPLVYEQLCTLAARQLAREHGYPKLEAAALVHETWLRLIRNGDAHFDGREHFLAAAAEAMRQILAQRDRQQHRARRGGARWLAEFEDTRAASARTPAELLAVHECVDEFALWDSQKAELVKLRYFSGYTLEEAAVTLGVSLSTAKRWWSYSRAWLHHEMASPAQGNLH